MDVKGVRVCAQRRTQRMFLSSSEELDLQHGWTPQKQTRFKSSCLKFTCKQIEACLCRLKHRLRSRLRKLKLHQ